MTFINHFIEPPEPPDPMGRELNAQTCSHGQHTLIDTYGAYPLRTPWLAEFTHTAYDPFELLDGDTSLLVCLMQAQLAADQENSTIQTFVRTAAHSATRSLHTASEGRRMYRTHQSLCLSHHSSASKQKQVQQTARRTFFVRKKIGRNKMLRTIFPVDTISLSSMVTCDDRHGAYLALAKMPGCTALIPPIKGHRDQCALYNMCEEACLFPGAFTQAEISLEDSHLQF